ncbi:hypothetical protein V2J09_022399 [Rumex salicifolius]
MEERSGDSDTMRQRCDRFRSWADDMELFDLGFYGQKYTWLRGTDPLTRSFTRLDRGFSNLEWRLDFSEASIKHLAKNQSDCLIFLISDGFGATWLLHEEFQAFVVEHWEVGADLPSALANLAKHLQSWNKDVFSNLFRHRDRLWRRIEGFQNKLCTDDYLTLKRKELDVVLDQIHMFWVQKARKDVLIDGDQNTKFFHACAVVRRNRNKIDGIFDTSGV